MPAMRLPVCWVGVLAMFSDVCAGLELRQDDAVAQALLADDCLRAGVVMVPVCGACGRNIDRTRLLISPTAARCSLCVTVPVLAMRR